jgi:hypothetical protein
MTLPNIVFGAGGIGKGRISHTWTTPESTTELLDSLEDLGLKQLDSGASYPPGAPWVTETLLGQAEAAKRGFVIDTKVLIIRETQGKGSLSEENIDSSLKKSLELLGVEKVSYPNARKGVLTFRSTSCTHINPTQILQSRRARERLTSISGLDVSKRQVDLQFWGYLLIPFSLGFAIIRPLR